MEDFRQEDVVRSAPKTTHKRIKNLKGFAYKAGAKMPSGRRIGVGTVKLKSHATNLSNQRKDTDQWLMM